MGSDRRIEYVRLDEIAYTPGNPKRHDAAGIAASINRQGYVDPVIVDERTGLLVSGHGRCDDLKARRDRGENPPDGIGVDEDGAWLVPVVRGWASRSDADARAYIVGANQLAVAGGWDDDGLAEWLEALAEEPDGLDGTGFTEADLPSQKDEMDTSPQLGPLEFKIIVECDSEEHQAELLARFEAEGLTVTALMT